MYKDKPNRWAIIILWMINHSLAWATVLAIGILLPSITSEFKLSYFQQGLVASVPIWLMTAFYIPSSMYSRRFAAGLITTGTVLSGILFVFLQAIAPLFNLLLAFRLVFGITIVLREPTRIQIMQALFRSREILVVNAIQAFILCTFVTLAVLTTPLLLNLADNSWRTILLIFCGISLPPIVIWVLFVPRRIGEEFSNHKSSSYLDLLKNSIGHQQLWIAGLGFFGVHISWSSFIAFYPTLMFDSYRVSLQYSSYILGLALAVSGIAGLAIGLIAHNWRKRSLYLYISGVFLPCTYILHLFTDSLPFLLAIATINGLAWGFFPICLTIAFFVRGIPANNISIAHAFMFTCLSLGLALGPIIAGSLQDLLGDLRLVLVISCLPSLGIAVVGFSIRNLDDVQNSET